MKLYKVLNDDLTSPYMGFQYDIGEEEICIDFDESNKDCSKGFYAGDIESIVYRNLSREGESVFEVEVSGREAGLPPLKRRFERQTIIRKVPTEEVRELLKERSKVIGWDCYHAIFPVNPLEIHNEPTDFDFENLKKWASVGASVRASVLASVGASVGNSVWASVWASVLASVGDLVWDSVWDSVWASVWDSVRAYSGSLFHLIEKWEYAEHKKGEYPFQSAADLWNRGFIPIKIDGEWKLWSKMLGVIND